MSTFQDAKLVYYVLQDGADFYMYSDKESNYCIGHKTAPFVVRDGDIVAAEFARGWFEGTALQSTDSEIHWIV